MEDAMRVPYLATTLTAKHFAIPELCSDTTR
jgi:hypothetical protein